MNLNDQVEAAVQEVVNAREVDGVKLTLDEFAEEVYYYVSTTRYTETGMSDSKVNRFRGKANVIGKIKEVILSDNDYKKFVK